MRACVCALVWLHDTLARFMHASLHTIAKLVRVAATLVYVVFCCTHSLRLCTHFARVYRVEMAKTNINDLASKLSFYTPPSGDLLAGNSAAAPKKTGWFGGSSAAPVGVSDEESAGLMTWASAKLTAARGSVEELQTTRERYTTFAILAICGSACMILAFTFLPIVILSPHKFALLFTMGSALIITSFSFLRGHVAFISHLASVDRLPFTGSYLVSLVGTLYGSLVMGSYLLTLIFSIIQVVALSYFLVSYIPGGTSALTFVGSLIGSSIKGIFVRG